MQQWLDDRVLQILPTIWTELILTMDDPQHVVHEAVYCLRGRNDHMLRTDRWALIRYGSSDLELYDMHAEPHQFTNLATDPQHQKTLTDLADEDWDSRD